jgi:hypothetical protein
VAYPLQKIHGNIAFLGGILPWEKPWKRPLLGGILPWEKNRGNIYFWGKNFGGHHLGTRVLRSLQLKDIASLIGTNGQKEYKILKFSAY